MKGKHNLATRLGGGFLAAIMLLSILPVSTIAMAVGSGEDVTVTWTPNTQTQNGTRTVALTAQLVQSGDTPVAAMVEISLTAEEAGALSWEGETISDSDLAASSGESTDTDTNTPDTEGSQDSDEGTTQAPDTEDSQDSDPETPQDPEPDFQDPSTDQQEADGTEPSDSNSDTGETDTPLATVTAAQSRTAGEQAVLIKKADGSGAVLRILLSEEAYTYTKELTFISEKDTTIHVDNSDINVETYEAESVPSSITAVGLLTAGNANASITTSDFTVFSHIPEEIAVSVSPEPIDLDDDGSKDIVYTVELQQIAAGEDGKDYTLSVALLESLSLPAGALSYSNGSIQCGETQIATLKLPGGITIKDDSLTKTDNSFSFIVTVPAAVEGETEIATHEITLTLHADKLARSSEAFTGSISLTVNAEGEDETAMASATATVTAGGATLPGEGGWNVQITKTENLNQNVFWRDNEQTSARPAEWDNYKTGFWPTNAKLYYTLTDENGVTYERTLLTEDTLKYVGLTSYPGFAVYNGHGFTVEDLPHTIQQVDPNDETNVRNTYTITWSLEPPENVAGYDFRNISQSHVGTGNEYPSIDTPGWYYMQKDSFTFTLNIRQGEEDPLGEDDERAARLRALLQNFQFNWSYADIEDSNGILDMIEAFHAVPSYNEGTITINGMWKYNVDGSPINYSVTEIKGDDDDQVTPDYKITAEELGDEESLLEDGEWYQIQYVNTGVPGEGQDTTALHSGGTLQLVRQGNTQYEATKIWLDSYGDSEGSGRPTANFTLYRYRKGEDPSTAAQLNGYTIQLKNKEAASGYSVQVMKEDGETTALADLPKYDTLDGAEFIYVVRETLSGSNAGQYEQVFGTVTVGETGKIEKTTEDLPADALPDGSTDRPAGNTYLYNDGTLTNYQTGTIPVSATKTWLAAAYQSTFDDVAVELTLQYREKDSGGSGEWKTYTDSDGKSVIRYLHRFYAESLSDTLMDPPSMPQYQTTQLSTANQELEYRWLETAVYTGAANAEENNLNDATGEIEITYPKSGENSATGNNPKGSFNINSSNYTVSYAGGTNNTQITNSVAEYLDYEVIKEWHKDTTPGLITIQILRSVAGGDFQEYLEFTMNAGVGGTVTVTGPTTTPTDVSKEFKITEGAVVKDSDDDTTLKETWNATVSGLPRFDEQGRPYEYLLLEKGKFPTYQTEIDDRGNYTTTVINGSGDGGFNLLVRKVWLDDGDMEHREPVTLTLYNKNNNQPVKDTDGSDYTITLGGEGEENLWHKVVRIGTSGLGNTEIYTGNKFDADDVYLVETEVGDTLVDHHLEKNDSSYDYDYIYRDEIEDNGEIFEVQTDNHRYQVTYKQEDTTSSEDPVSKGVGAAFTITNRRLGSIDLTVTKDWVDGREGNSSQVQEQIRTVLEKYATGDNPTYLALAFRLVFDDSMADKSKDWNITYSGPSAHSDTVCVGGEDVQIYSTYQKDDQKSEGYNDPGSSEWIILGYVKDENGNWTFTTDNSAQFLGLPKYDTNGEIVAYSIEEVWLDVTKANENTPPEVVDFDKEETQREYSELYTLWQDFSADYQWGEYDADVDGAHTRDEQTLKVTNARRGSKTVQWTVEWQDDFTHNSDLRPDIYLDIYQVTYTYNDDGSRTPVISRVTGRTLDWDMSNSGSWTATMSGVPAFDEKGNEIFYYAVQRTVMAAGDYDYQVAQYEMDTAKLGTRDQPAEGVATLNSGSTESPTTSITDANGKPYNLAVLGKRDGDETDPVDSIQWSGSGQPTGIGLFGTSNNYPKYALLEGGTIINTLAETYTIEGVKYWTNLPNGWEDSRLPQVTFTVSRHTADKENEAKEVAKVVISSDLWEKLRSGTQYKYLIAYEGINVLGKESNDENGNGINGEVYVKEVLDMNGEAEIKNPTPLPRYQSGTGALWTYTVEETVDWGTNKPDDGYKIFDNAPGGTGFTFTNNYNPTTGSIQVKKYLYLPMTTNAEGKEVPESYPAVTFRLERWLQNVDGDGYDKDDWSQDITLTSDQVKSIWENTNNSAVTDGALIDSGKNSSDDAYIWATLEFGDLPLYAPDGTKYQYSVAEDRTYLQGYDTWGKAGDVINPSNFDDENKGTISIDELEPEKVAEGGTPTVDATFKNQRTDPQEKFEKLIATKIWEDNNSSFRPDKETFDDLLTLTRTAKEQGGTGGAAAITEVLTLWDGTTNTGDYEIQITEDQTDTSKWLITITPVEGKSFEKYAPNGMEWTYTLKERVTEKGRLQITVDGTDDSDKIYTPSTPNGKTNGEWQHTITSKTEPVSSDSETYSFGSLTNSIMTLAKFEKKWVDAEDNPITQDYLGFDLTVEFRLQVREMSSSEEKVWVNASEWKYDGNKTLGLADGADTNSLTGRVVGTTKDKAGNETASSWTYTFENLPGVVQDSSKNYIFLEYRVIETKVSWGAGEGQSQAISWDSTSDSYSDLEDTLVTDATFHRSDNTSTTTNQLDTTSVSVTKVWDDTNNQYGTRPGGEGPWSWASWFVLQRTTEENPTEDDWENVAIFENLYGNNAESRSDADPTASGSWTATITGLPTMDYSGTTAQEYTYRVRELQPKEDGYTSVNEVISDGEGKNIVDPNGTYNPDGFHYTATYTPPASNSTLWTVTNSMDTPTLEDEVPKNVEAIKRWVGSGNGSVSSVTFRLQYKTEGSEWKAADFLSGGQWEKTANASNHWTVRWEDLPDTDGSNNKVTGYQVVEEAGSGWVQIGEPVITHDDTTGTTTYSYTFTNSITTSYSVEKEWLPSTAATHEVTLGLYRTTAQEDVGSISGTLVPVNELATDGAKRTVTLDGIVDTDGPEKETWKTTFSNLPKYNASGQEYYYYALELDGNNNPIVQNGTIVLNNADYEVSYSWAADNTKTTVTNTTAISLTGTKTWKDDSNEGNTRPTNLTLILERRVNTDEWSEDLAGTYPPTWNKPEGSNEWTYTFSGLPSCDSSGALYEYRVREEVPTGYKLEKQKNNGLDGEVDKTGGNYDFTNIRTGTVSLVVNKTWVGDTEGNRPMDIDLKVERKLITEGEDKWTDITNTISQDNWTKPAGSSEWALTYTDLDWFDENGVRYEYRITEVGVPDGYEVKNSTNTDPTEPYTIQNIRKGALEIRKEVSGNRGETDREFHFTVTLTGASTAGTQASEVNGDFTAIYTRKDGTTNTKITFTGGVSTTEIALKDEESVIISGLPAGLHYEVTETEKNTDGYSTTGTGWTGTIPTGDTAQAEFENYRNSSSSSNRTDVSGTKTWVDDSDAAGLRPDVLELTLYRSVDGGPEQVVNATPTWTKTGNVWTYRYANLPKYDSSGRTYTYRVVETVPEGYVSAVSGNNFTNTLTKEEEKITLTGHKSWLGDTADDRPESITVVLYDGDGQVVRRVTVTAAENWSYVFADLPRYDAEGNEIPYYVREEGVPAGYQVSYDGLNIVNRKEDVVGALRVTKQVTGTGAEYDRAFSFTVTLEDRTINGTYGEMTFVDGVATFTLRHGQSVTAVGLPAGIPYTVTETVPEGYTASDASQTGEIPASDLATVTVVNNRDLPEEPTNPEDPEGPENPDVPDSPEDPAGPEDPQGPEVQTGDRANLTLYGGLAALFAAGLAVTLYWGKKEDRKKDDR